MSGYLRMRRDLSAPIPPVPFPIGILLVPYTKDIARLSRTMMQRAYPGGLGDNGISFEGFWNWLTNDPEFDPDVMFVAMAEGAVVGLCHCWSAAFVKDLAVDPDFQGRGLGAALLTTALDAFRTRGAPYVDLKTGADNIKAQSLYQRVGFVVIEHIPS